MKTADVQCMIGTAIIVIALIQLIRCATRRESWRIPFFGSDKCRPEHGMVQVGRKCDYADDCAIDGDAVKRGIVIDGVCVPPKSCPPDQAHAIVKDAGTGKWGAVCAPMNRSCIVTDKNMLTYQGECRDELTDGLCLGKITADGCASLAAAKAAKAAAEAAEAAKAAELMCGYMGREYDSETGCPGISSAVMTAIATNATNATELCNWFDRDEEIALTYEDDAKTCRDVTGSGTFADFKAKVSDAVASHKDENGVAHAVSTTGRATYLGLKRDALVMLQLAASDVIDLTKKDNVRSLWNNIHPLLKDADPDLSAIQNAVNESNLFEDGTQISLSFAS